MGRNERWIGDVLRQSKRYSLPVIGRYLFRLKSANSSLVLERTRLSIRVTNGRQKSLFVVDRADVNHEAF